MMGKRTREDQLFWAVGVFGIVGYVLLVGYLSNWGFR